MRPHPENRVNVWSTNSKKHVELSECTAPLSENARLLKTQPCESDESDSTSTFGDDTTTKAFYTDIQVP